LESLGVRFLRFSEADLKYDLLNVLLAIEGEVTGMIKNDPSIRLPEEFDMSMLQ
jgi:hypothetical protein